MNILEDSACTICEFAMQSIAKEIGNSKTRVVIERVVGGVCNHLPKTVGKYCFEFVDNYVDAIIVMLSEVVSTPKESCTYIGFCKTMLMLFKGTMIKVIITFYNYI